MDFSLFFVATFLLHRRQNDCTKEFFFSIGIFLFVCVYARIEFQLHSHIKNWINWMRYTSNTSMIKTFFKRINCQMDDFYDALNIHFNQRPSVEVFQLKDSVCHFQLITKIFHTFFQYWIQIIFQLLHMRMKRIHELVFLFSNSGTAVVSINVETAAAFKYLIFHWNCIFLCVCDVFLFVSLSRFLIHSRIWLVIGVLKSIFFSSCAHVLILHFLFVGVPETVLS